MKGEAPRETRDAARLAALHRAAFESPWDEAAFAALLASPGVFALVAGGRDRPDGFVLARAAAEEAEILTLAVIPPARRRGIATGLMTAAAARARDEGAEQLFLEAAADNAPALALYGRLGFRQVGRREGYYARAGGGEAALALRLSLNR
ncbi:MAG: GNAT family N-acetyltransferase [Caulobacteraceae bacterium]|nr:GNAT family N-acetyltransferase [Caulobacteraceae bacterium]